MVSFMPFLGVLFCSLVLTARSVAHHFVTRLLPWGAACCLIVSLFSPESVSISFAQRAAEVTDVIANYRVGQSATTGGVA